MGRLLDLARQVVLARMVSPTEFGIYALALTIFRLATTFSPLGLPSAVIRFAAPSMHDAPQLGRVLGTGVSLSLVVGVLSGALLLFGGEWIAAAVFDEPTLIPLLHGFALALLLSCVMRVCLAITTLRRRVAFLVLIEEVVQPGLYLLALLLLVALQVAPLTAALIAAPVTFGLAAWIAFVRVVREQPALRGRALIPDPALSAQMFRFGLPLALSALFLWSTPLIDRLLVGVYATPEIAGVYVVVAQLASLFTLIGMAIETIQSPIIANLVQSPDTARTQRVIQTSVRLGLMLGVPAVIVLVAHSRTLLALLFGDPYAVGGAPLLILGAAMLLRVISDRAIAALVMSGHNRQWLTFSTISFIVNLALDLLLIPPLGMTGAALSTMAVNIFLLVALAVAIWQRLGIRLFERSLLVFIPIALLSVVVGLLPAGLGWIVSPLLELIVYTGLAGGVCALLTWRFILPPDERGLVAVFMRRLTRIGDK